MVQRPVVRALLLSGGLDSTAIAYWHRPEWAITVNYGQRAANGEVRAAKQIADRLSIRHAVLNAPLGELGTGDLSTTPSLPFAPTPDWWPCRNQLLLTLGAPWALRNGIQVLMIGCVANDQSHGDASIQFIDLMNALFALQKIPLKIEAPAINLSKVDLIRRSAIPFGILALGHSCHTGEFACGYCRACNAHRATMEELGVSAF